MIIKRVGWVNGLNPRSLWEDTKTGSWGYISYMYSTFSTSKNEEYKFYKRYVQSLPKYEIILKKDGKK